MAMTPSEPCPESLQCGSSRTEARNEETENGTVKRELSAKGVTLHTLVAVILPQRETKGHGNRPEAEPNAASIRCFPAVAMLQPAHILSFASDLISAGTETCRHASGDALTS